MTISPILELKDIHKTYQIKQGFFAKQASLKAVNGVSLSVKRGETLGLVGESGCGKSTMAKMLLGLEIPTSGEILINGMPADVGNRLENAKRIQPIFQDPNSSLNPRKTVRQIIRLPLDVHMIGTQADRDKMVTDMLDVVGMPKRSADSYALQLSGGQRQRIAIARALIMKPEIVICDEPTSALDVSVQAQILNLLNDLKRELHLTYVFISHDLSVVEHLADQVAVMYLGRIVESQPSADLFKNPQHPYTKALLGSVLTPEPGLGVPDTNLGAVFPNPISPPSGCTFHPRCCEIMDICNKIAPTPLTTGNSMVECHKCNTQASL